MRESFPLIRPCGPQPPPGCLDITSGRAASELEAVRPLSAILMNERGLTRGEVAHVYVRHMHRSRDREGA